MTRWPAMLRSRWVLSGVLCVLVAIGIPGAAQAAAGSEGNPALQAKLHDVEAKVSKAQDRNAELQARVAKMERENAERQTQLQQRDQEIAALQQKLEAAGATPSAASSGH